MQWFKIPPKIYFEKDSVQYLQVMPNISRAFIVSDPMMVKLGYVDKVLYYLRKRENYCHCEIFSEVEPDPSVETIQNGVRAMNAFQPDVSLRWAAARPSTRPKACGCSMKIPKPALMVCA